MSNVTALLAELPTCVQQCLVTELEGTPCGMDNLRTCFCPSDHLQKKLTGCVIGACDIADRIVGIMADKSVCAGTPIQSYADSVKTATIVMMAISFPIVILRCLSRMVIAKKLWWDDYTIILGAIVIAVSTGMVVFSVERGFGHHVWDLSMYQLTHSTELYAIFFANQMMYTICQDLVKISILLFYIRIFMRRWVIIASWAGIAFMLMHGSAFIFLIIFRCTSVTASWNLSITDSKCIPSSAIFLGGGALSIFDDLVILLLPIPELYMFNAGRKRKAMLGFMFGIGAFATVTSIIRLAFIVGYRNSVDPTYDNARLMLWSVIEIFMAIICACLPFMRPVLSAIFPTFFESSAGKANGERPRGNQQIDSPKRRRFSHLHIETEDTATELPTSIRTGGSEEHIVLSHMEKGGHDEKSQVTKAAVQQDLEAAWDHSREGTAVSSDASRFGEVEEEEEEVENEDVDSHWTRGRTPTRY